MYQTHCGLFQPQTIKSTNLRIIKLVNKCCFVMSTECQAHDCMAKGPEWQTRWDL